MDPVKDAFGKVRQDIESLRQDLNLLVEEIIILKEAIKSMSSFPIPLIRGEEPPHNPNNFNLSSNIPTDNPTHNYPFKPLKPHFSDISIGNKGVPTDKQTNRQQTIQHIENTKTPIESAVEILNSLDNVRKEIRLKFKRLTEQEWLVFSTLYQLEEELGFANYRTISGKLGLTESSIRDYIGRLIKKGVPVEKNKLNNKNIRLSVSENLKKIAPLTAIIKLREI